MLNHDDNSEELKRMVLFCIAAASCVLLVFLILLVKFKGNAPATQSKVEVNKDKVLENTDDIVVGKNNLVSADLDFWDMYEDDTKNKPDDEEEKKSSSSTSKTRPVDKTDKDDPEDKSSDSSMNNNEEPDDEDVDDGEHLKVTGSDGKPAYYKILDEVPKNDYNFKRYLQLENKKLKYTDASEYVKKGIDISKYQGNIDFTKMKNNDIDFVMVRVAGRGYETGNITIDDKFVEYIQGALSAGLPVGVYFNSQAVNDVEAIEEANYAVAASLNYTVAYPIAIYLDNAQNGSSRTGRLDNTDRTLVVKKFCDTVKSYGKVPIICAPRDYLIAKLDLEDLRSYDIWIRDDIGISENLTLDSYDEDEDEDGNNNNNEEDGSSSSTSSSSSSSSRNKNSTSSSSDKKIKEENNISDNLRGPDFPYRFSMWQYTENGGASGINGKVNVNLCFENYDER